jgi:transcriptional regulator with XRE-family HTH domain
MMGSKNKKKDYLDVVWDQATLGSMVRSLRMCDEVSQTELAKKIGCSRQFLNAVEHNRKSVGIPFVRKLSEALDYPVEPFLELLMTEQLNKEGMALSVTIKPMTMTGTG